MHSATSQDIRFALRTMSRSPGFTIVALIVIALGIGVTAALFSVVNSVILRPLPYGEPERLAQIGREFPVGRSDANTMTQYVYWRDHAEAFEGIATYEGRGGGLNLITGGEPEHVPSLRVSTNFFDVLKVPPQIGRGFVPEDAVDGAEKVVILGDALWRRRFGADPGIVGTTIRFGGEHRTVVGVMARGFDFINHAEVWTPLATDPENRASVYYIVGRLRGGVSLAAARLDLDRMTERFRAEFPDVMAEAETTYVQPYLEQVVGDVRPALRILFYAVAVVLLIACANVANLLMARATGRGRELALRSAIGAGRARIVRQLVTESAVLGVGGALLGLAAAHWGMSLLIRLRPRELPRLDAVHVDGRVLGFTLVVTLVTVVLFGVPPALRASRIDLSGALKEGAGGAVGTRGGRARSALVVMEVALAMVLLVGAALLVKSFVRLTALDPGFDTERTLTMKVSFGGKQDLTRDGFVRFAREVKDELESRPGLEAAGTISTLPLEHGLMGAFRRPDEAADAGVAPAMAQWRVVTPGYFRAIGIPMVRGRDFDFRDAADSEPVLIVNQELARRAFGEEDPVGRILISGNGPGAEVRVVGMVGDVRESALDRAPPPMMFVPASQVPDAAIRFLANLFPTCWVVRTEGDPAAHTDEIRRAILSVDPEQPVASVHPMAEILSASIGGRRFNTLLLAIFAGQALLLAVMGVYGVMAYSVAQRTRETGVRMAIGATRGATLARILGQGAKLTLFGVALGTVGAIGLTRLLRTLLYDVRATDPAMLALAAVIVSVASMGACVLPALRATNIDPLVALREE